MRRASIWLATILLAGVLAPPYCDAAPAPVLNPEQKAWLAHHGKVRLGIARVDWPPFDIVSAGGHTGITPDYLALIKSRTGMQVETVGFDTREDVLAAIRSGAIDIIGSVAESEERKRFLSYTAPYVSSPPVVIARKDRRDISGIDDLNGRTVAVEAGYVAAEVLKVRYPGIKVRQARTTADALLEVLYGKADAYVGDLIVSTYHIDRNYLANLEVRGPAALPSGTLHFAARKDLPELRDILDAALATIAEAERREIRQRWIPVLETARTQTKAIELSPGEQAWIARHPRILVGVDPGWEPLDFVDGDGRHSGLASEYLRLMRERLGLNLEVVPGDTWAQTLARGESREVDMIAMMSRTPDREDSFLFTQPYLALPMAVVTRNDARFVTSLEDMKGETIAVMRDYFAARYIEQNEPEIVQITVANIDEALDAVSRGHAFATIGSVATLSPKIQTKYLGKLKIAGSLDFLQELGMAVRSDWPELATLLNKGMASISDDEHRVLRQKWLSVRVEYGINWWEVAKIAVPVAVAILAILGVILVWNRRLKRQMEETERKDIALKMQLAFQQTLMDTIPSPILFKDSDARIYGCNRAFEEAFGVTREELLGCNLLEVDIFPSDTRQRFYQDDLELLAHPEGVKHDEVHVKFVDGLEHVVLYWKSAFHLSNGTVGGLLGVMVDITPLKQLEQAAHEARDAADTANRAKSSFLATMSHEIRTPMNAIMGMLELLALTPLDSDQMRSVGIVRESAKSLLRIIDDILDFSKIEAGKLEIKPEPASVQALVDGVFLVYSGVASSKNLMLKRTVDPQISPALHADPLRLRQVLNNFVSNALKFTEAGEVEVRADLVAREGGRETLRLSVRDTGIGISPENQRKLFQPFVQAESNTTRRFGGTGLGLAICRRLAELMGGEVSLQSEAGRGTTMILTVTLPIADAAGLRPDAGPEGEGLPSLRRRMAPSVQEARTQGTLVLVADDHPTNRLLLVRQLNTLGYAAEAVENGALALTRWKSGRYGLLVTDCHMPEMDGYELARSIRQAESTSAAMRLPIIACTANALQGEAEVCLAAGMDDYMPKPIEMAALLAKLERWLPLSEGTAPVGAAAASAGTPADGPLDPGPLSEISGGDKALEREILQDYRQSNDADASLLDDAFARQDAEGVRQIAHRMKGASRMVGAQDLALLCERMEQGGRERQWDELERIKPRVAEELRRLNNFLAML